MSGTLLWIGWGIWAVGAAVFIVAIVRYPKANWYFTIRRWDKGRELPEWAANMRFIKVVQHNSPSANER